MDSVRSFANKAADEARRSQSYDSMDESDDEDAGTSGDGAGSTCALLCSRQRCTLSANLNVSHLLPARNGQRSAFSLYISVRVSAPLDRF